MKLSLVPKGAKLWLSILGILFAVSLCFPGGREVHVMCSRLLLHLKGKTFVQGQPSGCLIYITPNVQFTKEYEHALRTNAIRSPDDYILATATGGFFELDLPLAESWTNHPLLSCVALRLAWISDKRISSSNLNNQVITNTVEDPFIKTSREVIRLAQSVEPTNGALWLAGANLDFGCQHDQVALENLKIAAEKGNWDSHSQTFFVYVAGLLEKAGLSKLDAATLAAYYGMDSPTLGLQGSIRRNLEGLMTHALSATNDQRFSSLLGILVDLRKPDWADGNVNIYNIFYTSFSDDELVNSMARRIGRDLLSESIGPNYEQHRKRRLQIIKDCLDRHADPQIAARFWGQLDVVKAVKKLRRQVTTEKDGPLMLHFVYCSVAGTLCVLALLFWVMFCLLELPFVWLRRKSAPIGVWPKNPAFWIMLAVATGLNVTIFINFMFTIGEYSKVGFGPAEPPRLISPLLEAVLVSSLLCFGLSAALLGIWKTSKQVVKSWYLIPVLAFFYVVLALATAHFRSEMVERIAANYF